MSRMMLSSVVSASARKNLPMNLRFKYISEMDRFGQQLLCASVLLAVGFGSLHAAPPSPPGKTSSTKGSSVIYTSQLAAGNPTGGTHLTVVDLGGAVTLKTIKLQFANSGKVKVYVVKTKPNGDQDWVALAGTVPPNGIFDTNATDSLQTPATGEYLVIVSNSDLGAFNDFNFTGTITVGTQTESVSENVVVQESGHNTIATSTIAVTAPNGVTTTTTTTISTEVADHGFNRPGGWLGDFGGLQAFGGWGAPGETPHPFPGVPPESGR